jgi:DNA-binding SARP family transcriptional activator/tetratricopeptide (TPR) repeat protein
MRINILGAPELLGAERPVAVAPQLWCVLLSLVLVPGVPVPADVLVDRLWGDDPPDKARATIRSYVRRVELKLSEAAGCEVRASRRGRGYALDIPEQDVDLLRFRDLRRQSDAHAERGEMARAVTFARQAESLWRDGAFAGLPGDWVGRMRDTLNEELHSLVGRRVELELVLGRHARLLGELAELTDRYPRDEELVAQRMIALFRAGRPADALRVYQQTRTGLIADGLEPGPHLAQLHVRILQNDPGLLLASPSQDRGRSPAVDTLPPEPGDFVGRADETRLLSVAVSQGGRPAVQVIEGMGGVGKTTLAVRVARLMTERYSDGRLFLNLRAHDRELGPIHPADALRDLLTMVGIPDTGETLAERSVHWRSELATRRMVLILDDADGPDQVRPLIPDQAECLVIVTSRRHANWDAQKILALGVLSDNDATALFTKVAGRRAGTDLERVAKATELCGRLPLAIKLAATRLRVHQAVEFDDLLRELGELAAGYGVSGMVADGVHSAFDISYRQLSSGLRRFFRSLGGSPCQQISAQVAAALTGLSRAEAEVSLSALRDHFLMDKGSDGRFSFHDLIRSYALVRSQREDSESEVSSALRRVADHYLREARRASDIVQASQYVAGTAVQPKPLEAVAPDGLSWAGAWLASEWRNVLRVAEHCDSREQKRRGVNLIHSISEFLEVSGHWTQAVQAYLTALHASREMEDMHAVAKSAFALSLMCLRTGRTEDAPRYAAEAARAYGDAGDLDGRAGAIDRMGLVSRHTARFREALAHHQEAIDIYRATGDQIGMATAMLHAATALDTLGRHTEQLAYLAEALGIFRQHGDLRGQGRVHNNIGAVQHGQGYHRDAVQSYQAAYAIFRRVGGRQDLALLDQNMGEICQYKGRPAEALDLYRKARAEFRAIGDLRCQAFVLIDMGSAYQANAQYEEAIAHHEWAAAIAEEVADPYARGLALCGIADAQRQSVSPDVAIAGYERATRIAGEIDSPYLRGKALQGMAEAVLRTRGAEAARIYWREAHDIFTQIGAYEAAAVELRLQIFAPEVTSFYGRP